ncbi:hypothetical protein CFP56_031606 [Quercus suber]|uniref:Uncharacterized protein n=1 Tax=Quercus suber TaxID=58331 RepID=A0AAW0JJT2_QUESU
MRDVMVTARAWSEGGGDNLMGKVVRKVKFYQEKLKRWSRCCFSNVTWEIAKKKRLMKEAEEVALRGGSGAALVAELIDSGSGCWKSREIDECLVPFDAQRIKAIPLCITPQLDLFYWALEKNGAYSVKSGYRALCEEARNEEASGSSSGLSAGFWSSIWKLNVPGKVKCYVESMLR